MSGSEQTSENARKCGIVAVIGLPNAGKSTLTNALVGEKVSIVSRKVQTTRACVMGIISCGAAQLILVDTPGMFKASDNKMLEQAMVKAAWSALSDADCVVHLVDVSAGNIRKSNASILNRLPDKKPCFLALNKIDKLDKSALLSLASDLNEAFAYEKTFMVSALKNKGLDSMVATFVQYLPQGPWMFSEDQASNMPVRMMAAEMTRETMFEQLHQELPYDIMVVTENWEEFENGSVKIDQLIYVKKESQKGIVVGKGGQRIKKIGLKTRAELEDILQQHVHLKLRVKVQENWSERAENYPLIGLAF